ncbi:Serine/threonine-protein_phosphatase [Hexamita inflata]|uniref:Serine/threonine-protein phosphatase n=1 Tax=Hexamita inflata TaxID=28002 RepID=A0AA86TYU0_9EUKA|nr:Serine/threonine-protein phosphatase [Hexamita inflata]
MGYKTEMYSRFDRHSKQVSEFNLELTKENFIEQFKRLIDHQIPSLAQFLTILKQATALLKQRPNVVQIVPKPNQKIVVVGDLHGNFESLIRLFVGDEKSEIEPIGFPSNDLIYVFNGDFTDRGGSGYQIIFSLCFMLLFSDSVYLNRGNHESLSLGASTTFSSGHSFIYEMNEKFPEQREFYSPLLDFFSSLPLATQIQDVLVVHGGTPSTQYSINQLNTVNRFVQDLEPIPSTPENAFHEFLWSYNRNSKTASFLMQNKLQTLVVGHSSASFHSIYTFTKQLELHSIVKDETMFQKVKQMFGVGSNERLSVVEVFSSPTNGGELYAAVIECPGGRINNDPLKWEYFKIGQHKDFKLKHK